MAIEKVIIQNFKKFKNPFEVKFNENINLLVGDNESGKSTILEALDIFFNQAKIDVGDRNVFHSDEETIIGCVFDELPTEITLEDAVTSFSGEYLLNTDGKLEIWKKYPANGKQTIWIYANHPSNDGFNDLLSKKNSDLKAKIRKAHLEDCANLSVNASMRAALWTSLGDSITFEPKPISADQADEKKLWPKIEPLLPAYRLFKADRPSTDEDQEAQDPMQHAMKIALEEQADKLTAIAEEVQRKVSEVANNTILKLKDFDAELAARGFVALHLVDEGMLGKFALQGLGTHAFQVFPNGADAFLFQQGSYFLLRDEAGIYRVFYHQFHVLAHLRGGLAVESCDSHYQVSNDKQQNDRK